MTNDFYKKNERKFDKINDAIMKTHIHAITKIYIDLALIKDTRLGLLLSICTDKEKQYIRSRLKEYNSRLTRTFVSAFPKLKYEESKLQSMYRNSACSEKIFNHSPDTTFSLNLVKLLITSFSNNSKTDYLNKIKVVINAYPLAITENMKVFGKMLENTTKCTKVEFININPKQYPTREWGTTDVAYIDDFTRFIKADSTVYKGLFENSLWLSKGLVTPYQAEQGVIDEWLSHNIDLTDPKIVEDMFAITSMVLMASCNFKFSLFNIPYTSGSN